MSHAIEKDDLRARIIESDRCVLLGHGLPQGLLGHGSLIIDDGDAALFREQRQNIYVWCNADCYLRRHKLKGFCTGMFISEPVEALIFNVSADDEQIEESNELFADIIGESLELSSRRLKERVLERYRIAGNGVVDYNRRNIFAFD